MVSRRLFLCGVLLGAPSWAWASGQNVACGVAAEGVVQTVRATQSVRSSQQDPRLAELVADGAANSPTLRRLIETLDASGVIVYVSFTSSPKLRSYLSHDLVATGAYRYLRVVISIKLTNREVTPVLAHELQHALEVAQARDVCDSAGMTALFNRVGYPALKGVQVRETDAALRVQQRVKAELASSLGLSQK
jgi:hypothetical protein